MKTFPRFGIILCVAFLGIASSLHAQKVSISASPTRITNQADESTITLSVSPPASRDLAINLVGTGTAFAGIDYILIGAFNSNDQVVIPAGTSSVTVTLQSLVDDDGKFKEFAVINVISGRFYRVGHPSHAQVTIENQP